MGQSCNGLWGLQRKDLCIYVLLTVLKVALRNVRLAPTADVRCSNVMEFCPSCVEIRSVRRQAHQDLAECVLARGFSTQKRAYGHIGSCVQETRAEQRTRLVSVSRGSRLIVESFTRPSTMLREKRDESSVQPRASNARRDQPISPNPKCAGQSCPVA